MTKCQFQVSAKSTSRPSSLHYSRWISTRQSPQISQAYSRTPFLKIKSDFRLVWKTERGENGLFIQITDHLLIRPAEPPPSKQTE